MSKIYDVKPPCFLDEGQLNVTSPYGERVNPITGEKQFHAAVDCTRWHGYSDYATITALADGFVETAYFEEKDGEAYKNARGNYVVINHGNGFKTLYQHLHQMQIAFAGARVKKGEAIGYMGNTGRSSGAHLHIEVQTDSGNIDPLPYLIGEKAVPNVAYYISLKSGTKRGDSGEDVRKLQEAIARLSPEYQQEIFSHSLDKNGELDGVFGKGLESTLKKAQRELQIDPTGWLDETTAVMLNANCIDYAWADVKLEQIDGILRSEAR